MLGYTFSFVVLNEIADVEVKFENGLTARVCVVVSDNPEEEIRAFLSEAFIPDLMKNVRALRGVEISETL